MILTIPPNPDAFAAALRHASNLPVWNDDTATGASGNLHSSLNATLIGRLEEAWDSIQKALRLAYARGKEQAAGSLQVAQEQVSLLLAEAGDMAEKLHAMLMQRLTAFAQDHFKRLLAAQPDTVQIGQSSLRVKSASFTQKLKLGGTLKASLESLVETLAEGEIEIAVEYEAAALSEA